MIPLDEARAATIGMVEPLAPSAVPVALAEGCVLAHDAAAVSAVPPFDASAMDGFAIRAADVAPSGSTLRVLGTVHAGSAPRVHVTEGTAVRIMTGAPVPSGADAVVMVERSRMVDADTVVLDGPVEAGTAIRPAGDDVTPGEVVLPKGVRLGAGALGAARSAGIEQLSVIPIPRVGVISTGDELVEPGRPLGPGQIYESNRASLMAAVRAAGFVAVDLGTHLDDDATLRDAFTRGAAGCDAVLSSGGVSMGDADLVRRILDELGDVGWMQIAIRPAKPFAAGRLSVGGRRVPVFGLPGNPVSSLVSFELLARPALEKMAGRPPHGARRVVARVGADLTRRDDGKIHFARIRLEPPAWTGSSPGSTDPDAAEPPTVWPLSGQGSHQMSTMARAHGFAVLPPGPGRSAGELVEVILLDGTIMVQ